MPTSGGLGDAAGCGQRCSVDGECPLQETHPAGPGSQRRSRSAAAPARAFRGSANGGGAQPRCRSSPGTQRTHGGSVHPQVMLPAGSDRADAPQPCGSWTGWKRHWFPPPQNKLFR